MKLSPEAFEKARAFVRTHARPVDARLYEYYFENGPAESVLLALASYQNADGGFGHGIEADFRSPASSPMATSVGLQYAVTVGAEADDPLIQNAIRYLVSTYDAVNEYWPANDKTVNDAPHAPWWHVQEITPPAEANWPNPSAELVGYLHHYAPLVPPDFLEAVTQRAQRNLEHSPVFEGLFRYNLLCWQRAAPDLPTELRDMAQARIRATYEKHPVEEGHFAEVHIFCLAPTPDSILARHAPETASTLLDAVIARQGEDGGWWPEWQWGQYEDAWPVARQEWAGKITVEVLHTLHSYGRIS